MSCTHLWRLEKALSLGKDPYEGLSPEEREKRLRWDTRRAISRKIARIERSEPDALWLGDIPRRAKVAADYLAPGETFEMVYDGVPALWPIEHLPVRAVKARRRK